MTHRFPLPTDAEIENLIIQVYESLPNPDQSRLSLIESRLLQKAKRNKERKKLNKIPWWIVLLLAGGIVSAGWWVTGLFFDKQKAVFTEEPPASSVNIGEIEISINDAESNTESNTENKNYEDKDSPIIYQRESF